MHIAMIDTRMGQGMDTAMASICGENIDKLETGLITLKDGTTIKVFSVSRFHDMEKFRGYQADMVIRNPPFEDLLRMKHMQGDDYFIEMFHVYLQGMLRK